MVPSGFDQENGVLDPPIGMDATDCHALSVWRGLTYGDTPVVISCWKVTAEELEEIRRTGRVWLYIMGTTMPPAYPTGFNPFEERENDPE